MIPTLQNVFGYKGYNLSLMYPLNDLGIKIILWSLIFSKKFMARQVDKSYRATTKYSIPVIDIFFLSSWNA